MADTQAVEQIRSDEQLGRRVGVQATPTLFINGRIYKGLRSAEQILKAIQETSVSAGNTKQVGGDNTVNSAVLQPTVNK